MILIREASLQDVVKIAMYGNQWVVGTRYQDGYSEIATRELLEKVLQADGYVGIAEIDDEMVGCLAGFIAKRPFTNIDVCMQAGFVVDRKHRGGVAAAGLLQSMMTWAQERGVTKIDAGISCGEDVERVRKFYEHCGFKSVGYVLEK